MKDIKYVGNGKKKKLKEQYFLLYKGGLGFLL